MSGFRLEFDFSAFDGSLRELGKEVEKIVKKSLIEAGELLRGDSTAIVPFQRGFNGGLAGSASTQLEDDETALVGYNMPYAAKMHEDMTLNISQEFAGNGGRRQQKYLEKPMRENAKKYGKVFADALKSYLDG